MQECVGPALFNSVVYIYITFLMKSDAFRHIMDAAFVMTHLLPVDLHIRGYMTSGGVSAETAPLSVEICSELGLSVSEGLNWEFAAVSPFCPRHLAENIWLLLVFRSCVWFYSFFFFFFCAPQPRRHHGKKNHSSYGRISTSYCAFSDR